MKIKRSVEVAEFVLAYIQERRLILRKEICEYWKNDLGHLEKDTMIQIDIFFFFYKLFL